MSILRLDPQAVQELPFPHLVTENIVEPSLFQELQNNFPPDELFDENRGAEWGGGRINIVRGHPLFERALSGSLAWRELYGFINSKQFVQNIIGLFEVHFEKFQADIRTDRWTFSGFEEPLYLSASGPKTAMQYYMEKFRLRRALDRLGSVLRNDQFYVTFDFANSRYHYHIPVHTDNRYKLAFMVIYLNDLKEDGICGGDLLLHRHNKALSVSAYPRYPGEENTEIALRVEPKPNLGVTALNCTNSYHSTSPMTGGSVSRKFMYIGVCKRFTSDMWGSSMAQADHGDARGLQD